VLKVGCGRCGAASGAACTNDNGKEATNAHAERIRAYLAGGARCDVCNMGVPDEHIVGVRYPTNVRYFPQDKAALAESKHPTPNPVCIAAYLIDNLSKPGDTVCDFTMGGGSTGVAAVNMGRYFVGIEMLYQYFYHAAHRIQNTALGSNKEYERARKLTNNFSQPRQLLEETEKWKRMAKKHDRELREWRELADKTMLAVLRGRPEGLTSSQARELSGLGTLAGKVLGRLEKSGAVARKQAAKGRPAIWTAGQGLAAAAAAGE
jgi:hypothetical protein